MALASITTLKAQNTNADIDFPEIENQDIFLDSEIVSILKSMTIKELVGQMTQIDLSVICEGEFCELEQPQTLVPSKLKKAFSRYAVGSVLNVGCGSGTISRDLWLDIQRGIQSANLKYTRHKVPILFGIDAIHGANYTKGATLFPQQIGQAATWNMDLIKRGAEITAYDVRSSGIHWNFSPVLDLGRQPLWSRFFETYGEDVFLAKACTRAAIQGYQNGNKEHQVAACMKHFLGYSFPISGKDRTPAWIDKRTLREYYLPTFQEAINEGALTIMINSGELNGTPVHADKEILTNLLRKEMGFDGIAVTDWEDIYKLHHTHRVAPSLKEAVYLSIEAGIDMSMTPADYRFNDYLMELVKEERISRERLETSVYRILKVKKAMGILKSWTFNASAYPEFGGEVHSMDAYKTAVESITLLKNKELLPLGNQQDIFVAGNAADDLTLLNGAWSHTWQGGDKREFQTLGKMSIFQGLKSIGFHVTKGFSKTTSSEDILLYCIGEKPATEVPGNINDLKFQIPEDDLKVLKERKRHGKKSVLIMALARPRIITHLDSLCDAVVHCYLPGDEGGIALAHILSGKVAPSGKLPFTYPIASGDIVHYDRKSSEDNDTEFGRNAYQPLYDFGHGLSYTTFTYSKLKVKRIQSDAFDGFEVCVNVTNTGSVGAKEVVQVFYRDDYASITPSMKKLCGFEKVYIDKGETKEVRLNVALRDLSFINRRLERVVEKGDFLFFVKDLSESILIKNDIKY